MRTAIINSDSYEKHITGDGHPEQPKRVIAIKEKLSKRKDLIWDKPDKVPENILAMTHSKNYLENLKSSFPQRTKVFRWGYGSIAREKKRSLRRRVQQLGQSMA